MNKKYNRQKIPMNKNKTRAMDTWLYLRGKGEQRRQNEINLRFYQWTQTVGC